MKKRIIILIILLLLVICSIIIFICISNKNKVTHSNIEYQDYSDVSNVSVVDAKLGEDLDITQGYLMTYVTKKSGMWYMSKGYIKDVKEKDNKYIYTIGNDKNSKNVLIASISNDKDKISKNNEVNFVFTIDISNGNLKLTKISKDIINYNSVTNIDFNDLYDNINKLLSTRFRIKGYLVTVGSNYYLYDTKDDYSKESNNYFKVNWDGEFLYTGNANVNIECNINNLSSLKNCKLLQ